MDFITKLFDFDFTALVPEMGTLLAMLKTLIALAVLAGPVAMVALGAMYLWKPAKEANYRYGYRTYFGMGGVEAWRFSQKIAGLVFLGLGGLLAIAMLITLIVSAGADMFGLAKTAAICLGIELVLTLAARLALFLVTYNFFDKNGDRRR